MTPRWPPLTVRARLIGLVLAIVLPFGALLAWTVSQQADRAREAAYDKARVLAENTADTLERLLDDHRTLLAGLAARPLVAALDPARCDPLIHDYVAMHPLYTTLASRDLPGGVICSYFANPVRQYNEIDHPWFFEGVRSGGFFVSDAMVGPVSRRWIVAETTPVAGVAGRPGGLLVLAIDLERLNQRVLTTAPASALLVVMDRQDRFLLRSADAGQWIGKVSSVAANDTVRSQHGGALSTTGSDGIRRIWGYTKVAGTGWRVAAGLTEAEVMAAHDRLRKQTLALGFIALLAVLALAWRIASSIVTPVRALATTAARVGGGDDTARAAAAGPSELQAVAQQFNQMLDARAMAEQALRDQAAALLESNSALADARRAALNLLDDAVEGRQSADAANQLLQTEVAQRKQADDLLRQSADRTRRILHAAAVGLWEWNLVTDAMYFSPEWKQQLGYADDEIANQVDESRKRTHPDDIARARAASADFREGRAPRYAIELRLRHKDGSWRWIHSEADLERNEKGDPVMMRGSHIDITERKQAEAAAIELERQFRESQKMEAVGTLASSIAHDFNNIMGAILGNVALARADLPVGHPAALSVAQIQLAGLRARSLVQKILSFTQRQAPQMQAQPLRGLVEEGIALLRATLPSGVTISRVLPAEPLVALVDATQVNQLLMNLGINAWHALQGQTGQIEVGLEALRFDATTPPPRPGLRHGSAAHLWVRDSGCGMTPELMQRIFEPFFTTKMTGQGTGLGLAAVASVVQAHGGVLDVDSTPGAGSCFHIYLPALEAAALEPLPRLAEAEDGTAAPEPSAAPAAPAELAADGQRVTYIDDDEMMRLLVERLLQRAGFSVTCHADAAEALDALRTAPLDCDLVITDFNMPHISGLDVARAVAALRPDLPVILTTGSLTDELIANALAAGVSALVNKERTFEELAPQALLVLAKAAH